MKNKILGSALMIAGTTIGAGMLAMPLTSAGMGFGMTLVLLVGLWLLLTYTGLLFMEVYQTAKQQDVGVATLASVFALTACNEEKKAEAAPTAEAPAKIKVGVMAGPEHEVAEIAAKVAKEKYNLDVEYVLFNDYALPNTAVSKGDLDANAMQHKPYLDKDSQAKGLNNLVIVGNTFVYPLAGYSKKIKSVNELQDGAVVAVPNDPSNLARALILLEKQGLIKLKDATNLFSTSMDIIENPKHLQVKEVDTSVAARALDDVDLAVVNNNYAGQVGLNAQDHGVFVEDKDSPYVNIIVARKKDAENATYKKIVEAYQTEDTKKVIEEVSKGSLLPAWETFGTK